MTSSDDYDEKKIAVGMPDANEGGSNKSAGASCTQKCKAYTFATATTKVRLIDTPGIGDTRGFEQDIQNMKNIVSYISQYEVLSCICILLRPNEERLTISFKYCVLELLSHLHKDASKNIIFCITNSRSTMYRPGNTRNLLKTLLSESPQTAAIKLEKSTMYNFNSEAFRFIASVKNGLNFSEQETDTFRASWKQSTEEADRAMKHIASLAPHDIHNTWPSFRVR